MPTPDPAGSPLVFGIDVGGTKLAAVAMEGGEVRAKVEHPTDRTSPEAVLGGIHSAVEELAESTGAPAALGVGVPSQVRFATGEVVASVNIPLAGVPLSEDLASRFGVPAFVDNDANCAALAEAHSGEGPPPRVLAMLTVGTGVGGGVVLDGAVFRGATGAGAELGHVVLQADGPQCPGACPNRGCLEALASGQALEREATAAARAMPATPLGRTLADRGRVTGRDVVAAARDGDDTACELMRDLGRWLGVGMASLVNALEPERLVVGGGLSGAADLFLDAAIAETRARALPAALATVEIATARRGADAGEVGAALLAATEYDAGAGNTA
jgi:glucokinase